MGEDRGKLTHSSDDRLIQLALESLPFPFCLIDAADRTVRLANPATGFSKSSGPVKCYSLLHRRTSPCNGGGAPCPVEIVTRTKKPTVVLHIHPDRHGNKRYFEVHGYPVFDDDGKVVSIIEYSQDITERRAAEEALKESEARWRSLVQHAPDMIFMVEPSGGIIFFNRSSLEGPAQEVVGKDVYQFVPPEHREMVRSTIDEVFRTGRSDSYELNARRDDSATWYSTRVGPIFHGDKVAAVILITSDISAHKQTEQLLREAHQELENRVNERTAELKAANEQLQIQMAAREQIEQALRLSEELHRVILSNVSDAIFIADDDGHLTWVCPGADGIFGYSREQLQEFTRIDDFLGNISSEDDRLGQEGELSNMVRDIIDGRGHNRTFLVNARRVNIKGGTLMYTCRDITRLDRTEKALQTVNEELSLERETLRQKNLALKEILSEIENEKKRLATQIHLNVNRIVIPVINALSERVHSGGEYYISLLRSCLSDLTSPFISNLERDFSNLTPRELEVCEMVKNGFTSKQIAAALNNSVETVLKQRKHIRKKLGISNREVNLVTYLKSLDRMR